MEFLTLVDVDAEPMFLLDKLLELVDFLFGSTHVFEGQLMYAHVGFVINLSRFIYRNELEGYNGVLLEFTRMTISSCVGHEPKLWLVRGVLLLIERTLSDDIGCVQYLLDIFPEICEIAFGIKDYESEEGWVINKKDSYQGPQSIDGRDVFNEFILLVWRLLYFNMSDGDTLFPNPYTNICCKVVEELKQNYPLEYFDFIALCGGKILKVLPDAIENMVGFFSFFLDNSDYWAELKAFFSALCSIGSLPEVDGMVNENLQLLIVRMADYMKDEEGEQELSLEILELLTRSVNFEDEGRVSMVLTFLYNLLYNSEKCDPRFPIIITNILERYSVGHFNLFRIIQLFETFCDNSETKGDQSFLIHYVTLNSFLATANDGEYHGFVLSRLDHIWQNLLRLHGEGVKVDRKLYFEYVNLLTSVYFGTSLPIDDYSVIQGIELILSTYALGVCSLLEANTDLLSIIEVEEGKTLPDFGGDDSDLLVLLESFTELVIIVINHYPTWVSSSFSNFVKFLLVFYGKIMDDGGGFDFLQLWSNLVIEIIKGTENLENSEGVMVEILKCYLCLLNQGEGEEEEGTVAPQNIMIASARYLNTVIEVSELRAPYSEELLTRLVKLYGGLISDENGMFPELTIVITNLVIVYCGKIEDGVSDLSEFIGNLLERYGVGLFNGETPDYDLLNSCTKLLILLAQTLESFPDDLIEFVGDLGDIYHELLFEGIQDIDLLETYTRLVTSMIKVYNSVDPLSGVVTQLVSSLQAVLAESEIGEELTLVYTDMIISIIQVGPTLQDEWIAPLMGLWENILPNLDNDELGAKYNELRTLLEGIKSY